MNEVLLTAGVAAVFIAVVGGGAKALGFEVPVLESGRRQLALGFLGLVFLGAAVVLQEESEPEGPDQAVLGYRQEVIATCEALPRRVPGLTAGPSIEKSAYLTEWRSLRDSWHNILSELWRQDAPDSLREDKEKAQAATDRLLDGWGAALDRLERDLPPQLDLQRVLAATETVGKATDAPNAALLGAMRRLAQAPCAPPPS